MMTGNDAGALGAIFGGVNVVAWYPITPSTSFVDGVISYRHLRQTKQEKHRAIVQGKTSWRRGITAPVGRGALADIDQRARHQPDSEFAGLAYFAEVPAVFWKSRVWDPAPACPPAPARATCSSPISWATATAVKSEMPGNLKEPSNSAGSHSTWRKPCRRQSSSSATWTWA